MSLSSSLRSIVHGRFPIGSHARPHASATPLSLALAITLLGACGDNSPAAKQAIDPSETSDEDDSTALTDDADDTAATADGDDSTQPPATPGTGPARMDSGVSPGSAKDGGTTQPSSDARATASDAGPTTSDAGPVAAGDGECCDDGNCLCHGDAPKELTSANGPYKTANYALAGAGCVYYPTDAKPPFAAVTVSDGFGGSGGCGPTQTNQWGPLYASWGIVAMIVNTGSGDQPNVRGMALLNGVKAFKAENDKSGSPLAGKLSGRYGTSGFSMGGGGTTFASRDDKTLLSSVAIMPWGPVNMGITIPTLVICGSSDTIAPCAQHGIPAYKGIADTVPKMRVQISSSHAGQPTSGMGKSGQYGLAFQKVFLEGDTRWRPLLVGAMSEETTIK